MKSFCTLFGVVMFCLVHSGASIAQDNAGGSGVVVVELFTSEGCSSCPAAEKVFANLHNEFKDACFLEFHVDYWNQLGWKDEYSDASYTSRQQDYAQAFGSGSTYTPQAIVNGSREMVGSDNGKLHSVIRQFAKIKVAARLDIRAAIGGSSVTVTYNTNDVNDVLNIALVQLSAETNVKRGENSGKKLAHTNVVRVLKTIDAASGHGNIVLKLPDGLAKENAHVIGYLQKKNNREVVAAKEVAL